MGKGVTIMERERDRKRPETPKRPEEVEQKFEVTEREKYLLQIMANVVAQSYLPSLGRERDSESKELMERILHSQISPPYTFPALSHID